ncbi:MAG TPA: radical SAM protein [Stellaceae bacterium]|nr:radical SAM protein [Stellaceae bacterium]
MEDGALLTMDGPVLVFGGPYSNLEATEAVLAEAARRGIPPRRILCTGDLIAYGADARATLDLVRRSGILAIMGNCEESLAGGAADCGCGYAEGSACDRLAAEWYAYSRAQLAAADRAFLAGLPRRLDITLAGKRLAVVHGSARQINRFLFASTPAAVKREELAAAGADGVIAGHCGVPFTQVIDGRLWHNAGAVGMPANDGTPRVWFSLLTPEAGGIAVEHGALAYDHRRAAAKMRAAHLPEGYAAALETGLWPSADVLPPAELAAAGAALSPGRVLWQGDAATSWPAPAAELAPPPLDPAKFRNPAVTLAGAPRAAVPWRGLRTLWVNTGTLCNIACTHCYIESSPRNDRFLYLSAAELRRYLDEIAAERLPTEEIGFTGGEPFMNPDILEMLEACLSRDLRVLVLTNAMRPMQRLAEPLLDLHRRLGRRLTLRVSLDHYTRALHEEERGPGTWQPGLDGLKWLVANGFGIAVAGRLQWGEPEAAMRQGFAQLFAEHGIPIDAEDPERLVIFPEMDERLDVPEIAAGDWLRLGADPARLMCASARMVGRRKGAAAPSVIACTLLPYDERFDLGPTLAGATGPIPLNHPHCAKFCVLGSGACG